MTKEKENARIVSVNIKNSLNLNSSHEMDLRTIYKIIVREKVIVIGTTLVITLLATLFALFCTSLYKAESIIQINSPSRDTINLQEIMMGIPADDVMIRSEMDILNSRYLAGRVVDKLNLIEDEELNPDADKLLKDTDADVVKLRKELRIETVDNFLSKLHISKNPGTYTVKVQFTSQSPEKAAKITNALVDEYVLDQMEVRYKLTKDANEWLNIRVDDLRKQVRNSEEAVRHFRETNNLIDINGKNIDDQQLMELNNRLALLRNDIAEKEARLQHSRDLVNSGMSLESNAEVLNSSLIQSLREQESQVLRKRSELATRYGKKHPQMINVNAELSNLRAKINNEIDKVIQGLENDVEIAKSSEKNLLISIEAQEDKLHIINQKKIQLAELVRQAESDGILYESFLSKYKENTQSEDYNYPVVRVVSGAEVPLYKSYPQRKLIVLIALMLGLGVGIAIPLIMEYFDAGFRTSEQVEKTLGLPVIGTVPYLEKESDITDYVLAKPTSFFTESLRATMTAIHFFNPDNPAKIIMLLSSIAQEGKSSYSLTLARMQAKTGYRVLLLDCDLRRSTIADFFNKPVEYGLKHLILGEADEKEVVCVDEETGLHYIPSFPNTPNSQEILASNKMEKLLEKFSEKYDFIFIDSSPLLPVSDSLKLAKMADAVVLVVKWGTTSRDAVVSGMKRLMLAGIKVTGVVLSRVDVRKQAHYGYKSGYDVAEQNVILTAKSMIKRCLEKIFSGK